MTCVHKNINKLALVSFIMQEILLNIIPVILIFILGYFFKRINLLTKNDADLFLKMVFYISLPCLIILSVTNIKLSFDFIYLPAIAMLLILITFIISFFTGKFLRLPDTSFGVFLLGSMIINVGFVLPFVTAVYGEDGVARLSLFDFGNGLLVFTFVYYFACKYGSNKKDSFSMAKKFILSPPLWALIISIALNLSKTPIPFVLNDFFKSLSYLTTPFIMLSLGIYFNISRLKISAVFTAIFIRMFVGLSLGLFFVKLFDLSGLTRLIVLIGSSAPAGYNTLTFSSLENLDKEFAANIVSFSILIGFFLTSVLIALLS